MKGGFLTWETGGAVVPLTGVENLGKGEVGYGQWNNTNYPILWVHLTQTKNTVEISYLKPFIQ